MRPVIKTKEIEREAEERESKTERSEIANELENLKKATLKAVEKRGRLPQPLFWSLFMTEVAGIKRRKKQRAMLEAIFGAPFKPDPKS